MSPARPRTRNAAMRLLPVLLALLLAPTTRPAMNPTGPFEMARFRWLNRPLLLFAPAHDDRRLLRQRQLLDAQRDGLVDRDIIVIELAGPDVGHARDPADGSDERLSEDDVKRLRLDYGVPLDAFAVVLVGKDGTEKRREDDVVEPATLFEQIDQMPMRKREVEG